MKTSVATIIRTVCLYASIIVLMLTNSGLVDTNPAVKIAVTIVSAVVAVINWWFNNSFTSAAQAGDAIMNFLKENPDVTIENLPTKLDKQ